MILSGEPYWALFRSFQTFRTCVFLFNSSFWAFGSSLCSSELSKIFGLETLRHFSYLIWLKFNPGPSGSSLNSFELQCRPWLNFDQNPWNETFRVCDRRNASEGQTGQLGRKTNQVSVRGQMVKHTFVSGLEFQDSTLNGLSIKRFLCPRLSFLFVVLAWWVRSTFSSLCPLSFYPALLISLSNYDNFSSKKILRMLRIEPWAAMPDEKQVCYLCTMQPPRLSLFKPLIADCQGKLYFYMSVLTLTNSRSADSHLFPC